MKDTKAITFSQHAMEQLFDRGATENEVEQTIREGEVLPAKKGRCAFRKNFPFQAVWKGKCYEIKQVMPIVIEESERWVVVTVYVFFIGGKL
jgi:hypothetical protein